MQLSFFTLRILKLCFFLLIILALESCVNKSYTVEAFDQEDLFWSKPYNSKDTIVFISERHDRDTLIFDKVKESSDSTRSFRQGFENTNFLSVAYDITEDSYHKFALMGDNKNRYTQKFLYLEKKTSGTTMFELVFIGTLFDNKSRKNISQINDSIYLLESKAASYSNLNVENGIKNFSFQTNKGIVEYTDNRNVKWTRE